jgi:hypothetical protein
MVLEHLHMFQLQQNRQISHSIFSLICVYIFELGRGPQGPRCGTEMRWDFTESISDKKKITTWSSKFAYKTLEQNRKKKTIQSWSSSSTEKYPVTTNILVIAVYIYMVLIDTSMNLLYIRANGMLHLLALL